MYNLQPVSRGEDEGKTRRAAEITRQNGFPGEDIWETRNMR